MTSFKSVVVDRSSGSFSSPRSRKAARPSPGNGPDVSRRTAQPDRANACSVSSVEPTRNATHNPSFSAPSRSPVHHERSIASRKAIRCRCPCPASRNRRSSSPKTWQSRDNSVLNAFCATRHSTGSNSDCRLARGNGANPGGASSSSSSSGPGRNHKSSSSGSVSSEKGSSQSLNRLLTNHHQLIHFKGVKTPCKAADVGLVILKHRIYRVLEQMWRLV